MKSHDRVKLQGRMVFGDFIVAMCAAWGVRRGPKMVRLAVNQHMVEFLGTQRFVISEK